MSGEFSWEDELDGRLDLPGGEGSLLVEPDESRPLVGGSVEDVVDEGVHDVHGLLGDSDVGVHLLEDLVDVDGEGLHSSSSGLALSLLSDSCHFLILIIHYFQISHLMPPRIQILQFLIMIG